MLLSSLPNDDWTAVIRVTPHVQTNPDDWQNLSTLGGFAERLRFASIRRVFLATMNGWKSAASVETAVPPPGPDPGFGGCGLIKSVKLVEMRAAPAQVGWHCQSSSDQLLHKNRANLQRCDSFSEVQPVTQRPHVTNRFITDSIFARWPPTAEAIQASSTPTWIITWPHFRSSFPRTSRSVPSWCSFLKELGLTCFMLSDYLQLRRCLFISFYIINM